MPKIIFYILKSGGSSVEYIACRLVAKAWREGHAVQIYTPSIEISQQLDTLLWSWQEDSFIPHAIITDQTSAQLPPVIISSEPPDKRLDSILINMTPATIANVMHCRHICEIVTEEAEGRALSRAKFRNYRQKGIQPTTYWL
ncbi:MAG: DNA polymerase III subunit chi [Endozoicomonas sp. (ex Botrylloides leachii)]|nr:DNA polymerase III subunit chi [Endozoicomonas sp. (ex Botrylloides leachii)]